MLSDLWVKYFMFDWVFVLCVGKWVFKICEIFFIFVVFYFKRFGIRIEWWWVFFVLLGYRCIWFGGEEWSLCLVFEI